MIKQFQCLGAIFMLAKSKTSTFILLVVFIIFGLASYWLLTDPLHPINEFFTSWLEFLIFVILLLGIAFVDSRTLVDDIGDNAFGWKGLIRWAVCGVLIGLVVSLIHRFGLSRVKGYPLLEIIVGRLLPLLAAYLIFRLYFRRDLLASSKRPSTGGPSIANMRWTLIIGGMIMVGIGFGFLYLYSDGQTKAVLLGVGIVIMGWCGVLSGAMSHPGRHDGVERRLSAFTSILGVIALIVLLTGILWR